MRWVVAAALVGCFAVVVTATTRTLDDDRRLFTDFKQTYGRTYSGAEEEHKFQCFRKMLNIIDQRNAAGKGEERHGVNQFTDLCPKEFSRFYCGYKPSNRTRPQIPDLFSEPQIAAACASVDWRQKGAVTPIKNQGQCGSCWSFSSTGNMEGQWSISGKGLVSLSEEELVQCSSSAGNQGCNGGLPDQAFQWVAQNGGITSEQNYPYTSGSGVTGQCDQSKLKQFAAHFPSHKDLPHDEQQMAAWACTGGPISIGVDATTWQSYSGGIMSTCQPGQLDHAVLIVGFDSSNSPPYWIVKNSWGTSWGESGYIRLEMGTNQCGLDQDPSTSVAGGGPGPSPGPSPSPHPSPAPRPPAPHPSPAPHPGPSPHPGPAPGPHPSPSPHPSPYPPGPSPNPSPYPPPSPSPYPPNPSPYPPSPSEDGLSSEI